MNNLFTLFLATIRRRFGQIATKIRIWTSPAYIKTAVLSKITRFFRSLLNVKPRDKNDYYTLFGWMFSKRLAYLIVIGVGLFSCIYVAKVKNIYFPEKFSDGVKTYNYNSLFLRFADGNVRIKGKGGYLAYEGQVSKGYVTGKGTLYDHDELMVYEGDFDKNKYQGEGIAYYQSGIVKYNGGFADNLYEGAGQLFYPNGTLMYDGGFMKGMKNGDGVLYANSGKKVYTGKFSSDEIIYSELLGKTTAEISEVYTGKRVLYEGDDKFEVDLNDIDVIYEGASNANSLDDSINVDVVYVLKDYVNIEGSELVTIEEIKKQLGEPVYEGASYVTQTEALAIGKIRQASGDLYYDAVDTTQEYVFDDYYTISDFNDKKLVYLYSFKSDGIEYTFVCRDKDKQFGFYYINAIEN